MKDKIISNYFKALVAGAVSLPLVAFAQNGQGGIGAFAAQLGSILNTVVPFIIGLGVFVVTYGILGLISSAADEEKRKQAKDFIFWGVLGVFCMLSVWGFVSILAKI